MMHRRKLVIAVGVVAVLLLGLLFLLLNQGGGEENLPGPSLTPVPTPSASPDDVDPELSEEEAHSHNEDEGAYAEALETRAQEGRGNPVLTALPHYTTFWELTFGVGGGDIYALEATVYYVTGREDPAAQIEKQKPFIIQYLRGIGQPDGTYQIEYETKAVNDSASLS